MNKIEFFNTILPAVLPTPNASAKAYAPANIALSKYWGKRSSELNLPANGSLSISLAHLGTLTTIQAADADSITLNGTPLPLNSSFSQKVFAFADCFRRGECQPLAVATKNTIPTAAGLASSASGFAALTLALNDYWNLGLDSRILSAIARIGSGSACRSLWHGYVKWQKGGQADGLDSTASPIPSDWQTLRIALLEISTAAKPISSGRGMNHTAATSPLYSVWPKTAEADLLTIETAIYERNFSLLGSTAEANALAMHATMLAARPALSYFQPATHAALAEIWQARADGLEIYATIDAGPNLKILYQAQDEEPVQKLFPAAIRINPFAYSELDL